MSERAISTWSVKPAGRPVRPAGFAIMAAAALIATVPAQPVFAASVAASEWADRAQPQWFAFGDDRAAQRLIELLETSSIDGLDPRLFRIKELRRAMRSAESGKLFAVDKANAMFDRALLAYVAALRQAPTKDWIINDRE